MKGEGIVSFGSRIDSRFKVLVIYKESVAYSLVKSSLADLDNSIGALMPGQEIILIDGERVNEEGLSDNHLLAIEAHEIAHEMLGHEGERNQTHEEEADELAIKILDSFSRKEAAALLRERVKSLRGQGL
jgi:hypothetical protein